MANAEELLSLSDEEISEMVSPPPSGEDTPVQEEENAEGPVENGTPETSEGQPEESEETETVEDETPDAEEDDSALSGSDDDFDESNSETTDDGDTPDEDEPSEAGSEEAKPEESDESEDKPDDETKVDSEDDVKEEEEKAEPEVNKAELYDKIMAPFKANGKEIKLESPEEAIKLMQMGANYTKKLMALQPNLKLLKMLENNGLLDKDKLSFYIDIEKKDPKAIQKLIKDSGIDPMDINTEEDPDYKTGNHEVSDEEMRFTSVLEEISSDPDGKEILIKMNREWDRPSKDALWQDPDIMRVMTDHKREGIYDQISSEVERRKMLGDYRNASFLEAYQQVGQELAQQGVLKNQRAAAPKQEEQPQPVQPSRKVVETRTATRKPVMNNDKARAASPVKVAPKKVQQEFNPLALSDEEFEQNEQLARKI